LIIIFSLSIKFDVYLTNMLCMLLTPMFHSYAKLYICLIVSFHFITLYYYVNHLNVEIKSI
jgi:hypothetical protein